MPEGAPRRGRDYTHEIIGSGRAHEPQSDSPPKRRSNLLKSPLLIIFRLAVLAAIVAGIWWIIDRHHSHHSAGISASVVSSVNFPLYYPHSPPQGFTPDQSATLTSGMVTFSYKYSGQEVIVEEQSLPPSIKVPPNPQEVDLKIGKAWLTIINQQPTALIQAPKTLLVITAQNNLPQGTLSDFAQTFQSVN